MESVVYSLEPRESRPNGHLMRVRRKSIKALNYFKVWPHQIIQTLDSREFVS